MFKFYSHSLKYQVLCPHHHNSKYCNFVIDIQIISICISSWLERGTILLIHLSNIHTD